MASDAFIQRVKTEIGISADHLDQRIGDVIDEAVEKLNLFWADDEYFSLDTLLEQDKPYLIKRAIYIYLEIWINGRSDLQQAWNDVVEQIRSDFDDAE